MPDNMISALMVTQPSRSALATHAIADFAAQTHAPRELVILHDGGQALQKTLEAMAARHPDCTIRVIETEAGQTLGRLRNLSVAAARGALVCQWDDDDRHHPERMALQHQSLKTAGADFCFLRDQLHFFPASGELYWDDWDGETYPFNFVQGTLLGRRVVMPSYPEIARGEDTALVHSIVKSGARIERLAGSGWCYTYVFHGGNVWTQTHHRAIVQAKSANEVRMIQKQVILRVRLAEYSPPIEGAQLAHRTGLLAD